MPSRRPEILAPAGDLESLQAALASGADAVYFGLDEGFNARARADNFSLERLPDTMALVHRAGVWAHPALNTMLSPKDLAGGHARPKMMDIGVHSLKVVGRATTQEHERDG